MHIAGVFTRHQNNIKFDAKSLNFRGTKPFSELTIARIFGLSWQISENSFPYVNKSISRPEMVSGSIRRDNCLHKLLTPALINYTFSNVSQASVMSSAINEKRTERWFTMSDYVT